LSNTNTIRTPALFDSRTIKRKDLLIHILNDENPYTQVLVGSFIMNIGDTAVELVATAAPTIAALIVLGILFKNWWHLAKGAGWFTLIATAAASVLLVVSAATFIGVTLYTRLMDHRVMQ